MKALALANRLSRDFDVKALADLTAGARLEILDAINGAFQTLHDLGSMASKTTTASLSVAGPESVTATVINGSTQITGYAFPARNLYCTIRITGDPIDNQLTGVNTLLHPYCGTTGTTGAVVYSDAIPLPETYAEMVGDPRILETNTDLCAAKHQGRNSRQIARPEYYWVEPNAGNQSPPVPAIIRLNPMPDKTYRMEAQMVMAPMRVKYTDLLAAGNELPIRAEHVESYFMPIARASLTHSRNWRNAADIPATRDAANAAKVAYEHRAARHLATPNRRVKTKPGY